jgi:aspartate ammonia-lyase
MPGKVNPVIPEAVSQAAMRVIGHDATITMACAAGSLELNPFLPLVADCLLESLDLLARADDILRRHCIDGLEADEARCRKHVENSTATATALVPVLGYERAGEAAKLAGAKSQTIRETVIAQGWLTGGEFDVLISPESVCRLGMPARSTDFQVCCVASFQTCARPEIRPPADLEIGDTAGLEPALQPTRRFSHDHHA